MTTGTFCCCAYHELALAMASTICGPWRIHTTCSHASDASIQPSDGHEPE